MNIYYVLCGNKYSEMLFKISGIGDGLVLTHRSNVRMPHQRIKRLLNLLFACFFRYAVVPLSRGNFILVAPHVAGNYGKLHRILNPNECIIIDDGITFEYWSDFHDRYILPLCRSFVTTRLVGPRIPNWLEENFINLKLIKIGRKEITEAILNDVSSEGRNLKVKHNSQRLGWLIDDGQMDPNLLNQLQSKLEIEHQLEKMYILWHPARNYKLNDRRKNQPAEVSILYSSSVPAYVIGKASTVLFNIAAYDACIPVASFHSEFSDLDESTSKQGIARIDINDYVKN